MKTFLAAALILTIAGPSMAIANTIFCSHNSPQWITSSNNRMSSSGDGPGLVLNLTRRVATWVGTGSYLRLSGQGTANGVLITGVSGSNPVLEVITDVRSSARSSETSPPTYQTIYAIKLRDQAGRDQGVVNVTLSSRQRGNMTTGSGNWRDGNGSTENFAFCTTRIRTN